MNRHQRRALKSLGHSLTQPPEKVPHYTSNSVDAPIEMQEVRVSADLSAPVADPRPIAHPGHAAKLKIYPDPETGEPIRAHRRHNHTVMYIGTVGIREYNPPHPSAPEAEKAAYEQAFDRMAKLEHLRLMTRDERRKLWKEEQAQKAERIKRQKAKIKELLDEPMRAGRKSIDTLIIDDPMMGTVEA